MTGSASAPIPLATARRFVTLMFSDLSDSTRLAAALEAEQYAAILAQLGDAYRQVIPRHGGTVVRVQGDGVLAMFGYPTALEDDGRRATEAALDLHAMVRTMRSEAPLPDRATLTLHTGIHAGLVLLGQGDIERGRFELMGNAPNIAARLSDAAGPDEILVSEETLGPERHFFMTGPRRQLAYQGSNTPLWVLPVVERTGLDNRFEARRRQGLSRFVGRQAELALLEQALHDTLDGRGGGVALSAAPGLGKTRLAQEFLFRCTVAGCQVLRGYCESYSGAQPLQPFLQILRMLFGLEHGLGAAEVARRVDEGLAAMAPELIEQRPALLQALSVNDPEAAKPQRQTPQEVILMFGSLVEALAAKRPLVLYIDDWQWADDASHKVLDALCAKHDKRVLVVLATRGFGAGETTLRNSLRLLSLQPLSSEEAAETVHRLLPTANPFLVDDICSYAGGNPLYIEELCHRVADGSTAQRLGRLQGGAAWLRVLIEARVTRLSDVHARLVRSAAVVGNVIPTWLFERITGCAADDERVRELADQDLIYPGEQAATLRFKHGITRDVIYEAVGLHERRALHLQIAQALLEAQSHAPAAGENTFEALAYHFSAAGRPAEAAHHAELAGDKAVAASALDRAQAQYRAALVALDQLEPTSEIARRWIAVTQRLGLACVFDSSGDDMPLFQRALELARSLGDPSGIARAQYWLAYIHYALGHSLEAIHHAELALAAAKATDDDRLLVQVEATMGQALAAAGRYEPALALLEPAIAVKQRHRSGAGLAVGLVYSLACKAYITADRGDFKQARACFEDALQMVGAAQHEVGASIRGWYGAILLWQGCWQEAHDVAMEGCRLGERVRSLFSMSMGRAVAGYASWKLAPNEQALADMLDTVAWLAPRGNALFTSLNHGWLADACAGAGKRAEARLYAARALHRGRQCDLIGVAMACRAMARLAATEGDAAQARRWVARALRVAEARGSAHERAGTLLCSAEVELALSEPRRAAALLDEAGAAFAMMDMSWHLDQTRGLIERL